MVTKTAKLLKKLIALHPKYIDLSLSRLEKLLEKLNNPHHKLPLTIHIAGTNGKGSTLSFINKILENNNYSVHTYTSPHLEKFRERISLNNKTINANKLLKTLEYVKKINNNKPITFFEITTAAAFVLFARHKADFLILETGLGGRLDATNIIPKKFISVITAIDIDHQEFLGSSIKRITNEKLGIIKNCENTVIARQKNEVQNHIIKKLKNKKNIFYFNKDYRFKRADKNNFHYTFNNFKKVFKNPSLEGNHQIENASTAITTAILLKTSNYSIRLNSFSKSILTTKWPGRIEKIVFKNKLIIFDGSHNLSGAEKLNDYLIVNKIKPLTIFGMLNNKNVKGFLSILKRNIDTLYPIEIPDEINALNKNEILNVSKKLKIKSFLKSNLKDINLSVMKAPNKYILITGSLYLVGKIRKNYL